MRPLLITPEIKDRIRAQVAWANRTENRYRAFVDKEPPGDNPAYVMMIEVGFRVVYSFTVMPDGEQYRHLSISVEGDKYPNEVAVYTIASLFGFTGGKVVEDITTEPGLWMMKAEKNQRCVVVAQRIKE